MTIKILARSDSLLALPETESLSLTARSRSLDLYVPGFVVTLHSLIISFIQGFASMVEQLSRHFSIEIPGLRETNDWGALWPEIAPVLASSELRFADDPLLSSMFVLSEGDRLAHFAFRRILDSSCMGKKMLEVRFRFEQQIQDPEVKIEIIKEAAKSVRSMGFHALLAPVDANDEVATQVLLGAGFNIDSEVKDQSKKVAFYRYELVGTAEVSGGRNIGDGNPCFVIAEAGSNWRLGSYSRDLKMGKALIDVAVESGCDAVKFQTYRAETTYVENAGESDYLASGGFKERITDIFKDLAMPYEMLADLSGYCSEQGIVFMSSAFSIKDLQEVDQFTPIHKIASYELTHMRLIEAAADTGKPLIISTGASDYRDIEFALSVIAQRSARVPCLMQCTAKYPAPLNALNVDVIRSLKHRFGVPVGLSDHSRDPIIGPVAAVASGANLIEKHFTLSNDLPGPDHKFAVTPHELKNLVLAVRQAEQVAGDGVKQVLDEEQELYAFARRSLQAIKEIKVGDKFQEDSNFAILRPGKQKAGMNPRFIEKVNCAKSKRLIRVGDGIQESDLEF